MEKQLYTVTEVAEVLTLSKRTVYRLIHDGQITLTRVGRSRRVHADELRRFSATLSPLHSSTPHVSIQPDEPAPAEVVTTS